jgi:hypothetical protein
MHDLYRSYVWQAPYFAAVLETDPDKTRVRIYEAVAAIEQRRLSPVEPGSAEERALLETEEALNTLIAERLDGQV